MLIRYLLISLLYQILQKKYLYEKRKKFVRSYPYRRADNEC